MSGDDWALGQLQADYGGGWVITEGAGIYTAIPRDSAGEVLSSPSAQVLRVLLAAAVFPQAQVTP